MTLSTPDDSRVTFRGLMREGVLKAIYARGVRRSFAERALQRWEQGGQPEPCVEEGKGKPYGLETGCRCDGCVQRLCFQFFHAALVNFGGATQG